MAKPTCSMNVGEFGPVTYYHGPDDSRRLLRDSGQEDLLARGPSSGQRLEGLWSKFGPLIFLAIPTVTSSFVLAMNLEHWTESGKLYTFVTSNRASTQLAVQIISHLLGLIYVTAICRIVNYSTRLRMKQGPVSLNLVNMWSNLTNLRIDWSLRLHHVIPLLAFIISASIPAALWAGAITPVITTSFRDTSLQIPAYKNVSLIHEYPSEINSLGPILQSPKGLFSYSVGMKYLGLLLSSAATATTSDGSIRTHAKFDTTRYVYTGRSYGVGGSVGLLDSVTKNDTLITSYTYLEPGYEPVVNCIYNTSSEFYLEEPGQGYLYTATGYMPDSIEGEPETSTYVGHDLSAIVALGVAYDLASERKYVSMAAGSSYGFLDQVQCSIDFKPSMFEVTVSLPEKNINVTRISETHDIEPTEILRKTSMRQFELIANDQTSLYVSLVGDSFNSSIADYIAATSSSASSVDPKRSTQQKSHDVLAGVTNSLHAMTDDILMCYAEAQFMIAKDRTSVPATVQVNAIRLGTDAYVYAIFAANTFVILCVLLEALRTRAWKDLSGFNYLDPRCVAVAASGGGVGLAIMARSRVSSLEKGEESVTDLDVVKYETGRMLVRLTDEMDLMLAPSQPTRQYTSRAQATWAA